MEEAVLSIYKLPASFSYAGFHRLQPNSSLRGRGLHNNSKTPQLLENKKSILEKVFNFVKCPYIDISTQLINTELNKIKCNIFDNLTQKLYDSHQGQKLRLFFL